MTEDVQQTSSPNVTWAVLLHYNQRKASNRYRVWVQVMSICWEGKKQKEGKHKPYGWLEDKQTANKEWGAGKLVACA
jgi:hypothetical protein